MSNNFFKQVKESAKEAAIKSARQMVHEPGEILKSSTDQISGGAETAKPEMSMMQEVMTGGGKVPDISPQMEQSIHAAAKSRLQQIEAELRQMRLQREQRSQDWLKAQNEMMNIGNQQIEKPKVSTESTGKPKHGPKGPGQPKKGNMEVGKQNKG